MYVVLWDGVNYGGAATTEITNIDKTAPTTAKPTVTSKGPNTITIQNNQTDQGGSGIKSYNYKIGDKWLAEDTTKNTYTFTGLISNTTYKIQTLERDNAGNVTNSEEIEVTTDKGQFTVTLAKGANIKSVSGAGTYTEGDKVTVSAVPLDNYTENNWLGQTAETEGNVRYKNTHNYNFVGWSGTYTQSSQTYTFTMPKENVNLTANGNETVTQTNRQKCIKRVTIPSPIYADWSPGTSFNTSTRHGVVKFTTVDSNQGDREKIMQIFPGWVGVGEKNVYLIDGTRWVWLAYENGVFNYGTGTNTSMNYHGYVTFRISLNSDMSESKDATINIQNGGTNPVSAMTLFNYEWSNIN